MSTLGRCHPTLSRRLRNLRGLCQSERNLSCKGFLSAQPHVENAQNHAWADIDRDGDVDLLVGGRDTGGGRPNFLFRNEIGHQNRWLAIDLDGASAIARDAFGARVSLTVDGETITREKKSSRGMYNSEDARTLHFGLGDKSCDVALTVTWPDGTKTSTPVPNDAKQVICKK